MPNGTNLETISPQRVLGGKTPGQFLEAQGVPTQAGLVQRQIGREEPVVQQLLSAVRGQEKPLAIQERLAAEAGVPERQEVVRGLRGQVLDVENLLQQLPEDIGRRTARSLVTEAQRRALETREARPLRQELSQLGRTLGTEEASLADIQRGIGQSVQLALQGQQQALRPFEIQLEVLSDRAARETTGFGADRQAQLDVLRDAMRRGQELSDQERQLAAQLQAEETQFERQKELAKLQASLSQEELRARAGLEAQAAERAGERELQLLREQIAAGRFAPSGGRGGASATEIKAQEAQDARKFLSDFARNLFSFSPAQQTILDIPPGADPLVLRGRLEGLRRLGEQRPREVVQERIKQAVIKRPDLRDDILELVSRLKGVPPKAERAGDDSFNQLLEGLGLTP